MSTPALGPARAMSETDHDPERIGRYEQVLSLGRGPLGVLSVSTAIEGLEQGRLVALRRVRHPDRAARQRAARAATVALTLRHPKVAAVLDVLERDDELVVVSEYVDGESVGGVMRQAIAARSPVPPSTAVAMIRDAVEALIAAREHFASTPDAPTPFGGLVPDGLRVAAFGETMLTEPGVLAALGDAAFQPAALPYRAPEHLAERSAPSERADVYTLGVMLWELLANRPLHRSQATTEAEACAELEKLVAAAAIPRLDSLARNGAPLPSALVDLVDGAVRPYPELRLKSLEELKKAIEALPGDMVASEEQVVVTLERLVHGALESRRAALSQVGDGRISFSPESKRTTARPPGPEAAETLKVSLPAATAPAGFSASEAPTARRTVRAHAAAKAAEASSARESTSNGVIADLGPPEVPLKPRRFVLPVAIGIAILAAITVVAVAFRPREDPHPTGVRPGVSGTPAATASAPALTEEPSAAVPEEPAPSASAEPSSTPAREAPTRHEPRPSEEPRKNNPKTYRPKGI
jgi:eukaryotic-like serine/threonine-protein kinase